ncbi:DMT family transporter [Peribacillus saganii]|uniref:DMT family transporter n=1 Tax=Peribacillus saganii TaxID=2303992 RepID=A0A372LR27_9BACI|nr:DMT family transporter [Peribacillus saganii]RFU70683.1 DMT family transporter [Peribacillus saganii]
MTTKKIHPNIFVYFLLLLVPLFWGGAFGTAKHIITEIPPFTAAGIRFGIAGVILVIITVLKREWKWILLRKSWRGLFMMAMTGIFSYNAFFFIGLHYTSAINGSLIIAASPIFITIGAVLFLKEKWNKLHGAGLLISLAGVLLVIANGSLKLLFSFTFNLGDILFLAALLSWVIHGLIGKAVMRNVSPLFTTAATTIIGSIFLLICSLFENGWQHIAKMSTQSWIEMIYLIVFASVIAFFLWNMGVQKIGASKAGIYMNLVPINAAWISVVFYGSTMTWVHAIGIVLVIIGVYLVTFGGGNRIRMLQKQNSKMTLNQ